jgi:mannosylglucosylglycerate synthase
MNIALLHYASAPIIGGVERVMQEHARLFIAAGHDVTVFTQRGEGAPIPADLAAALAGFDVVFVHNVMTMPFDTALTAAAAAAAIALPRVRFLAWTHDVAACNPDLAPAPEIIRRAHAGFEYVATSALRARHLRESLGVTARIIPNGLDAARVLGLPQNVARLSDEMSLLDGRLILFHPARLVRRKNVEFGLRVIAAMKGEAALLITGADDLHNPASREYAAWLRTERSRLGAGRDAIFIAEHFAIADAELAALYRMADALFFPSRSEGFGLPVPEAALHRIPIFCSDIEPLRENAPTGTVFIPPDATPDTVGDLIRARLLTDSATVARKAAIARFAWPEIYSAHLAPLLAAEAPRAVSLSE